MVAPNDSKQQILNSISVQRRQTASQSPCAFAQVYLSNHLRLPPSRMHEDLYKMLFDATIQRTQRVAVAAPRGHAKSTVVSLAYVLWTILYDHEKFILLVSATKEQAVQLLKNIKDEIQNNNRLLMDFPEVCHRPGASSTPKPWRDNNIALRNGSMIRVIGAGQAIRGVKHGPHRPGLIVVDDLENQEQCESAEQRHKLRDWFEKTLLKTGDERTNVIVVGTILHYDSLLANLTHPVPGAGKGVGWKSKIYRAIESFSDHPELWEKWEAIRFGDEEYDRSTGPRKALLFYEDHMKQMLLGTQVLWPHREDYEALMILRADEGRISFQSEKQNEPLDPEQCIFSDDSFKYWDDEYDSADELLRALGNNRWIIGACDPSLGRRGGRGDYSAIITIAKDPRTNTLYVIDANITRRKPDETIEHIVKLTQTFRYWMFAFEANQFQQVMIDQLRTRVSSAGINLFIKPVTNTQNKQARIEGLEPLITSGKLRFSRRHKLLLEQLRQFPLGAHDDGPDALEMAVTKAVECRPARFGRLIGTF